MRSGWVIGWAVFLSTAPKLLILWCARSDSNTRPSGFRIEGQCRALRSKKLVLAAARQKLTLPATLLRTWSAKGRQDLGTVSNDDTTSGGVCEIDRNVSADACRGCKNDAFDIF